MNEALVVIVRGVIAFFTMLIFSRALGKQQISQLTFFDYILGITIGSTASSLTTDLTSRAWPHWIGLLVWTVAVLLIQVVTIRWRYMSKYVDGEPTIVIMEGKIMEEAMKKMRYRMDDLFLQLRHNNIFDIMQVKYAILETDGRISILKKPEFQNPTLRDMNLPLNNAGIATELIYNGVVIEQNLGQLNHDRKWLEDELKKLNIGSPSEVFFMTLNPDGTLYTDKYADHLQSVTNISDYRGPY
ncbi:MAG: DUF421 domain-containing protein [Clostridiales bacterium]|nr:DUF421 domain-containing protein [Clostridiales bacterium]